jgi:hypothetical protein
LLIGSYVEVLPEFVVPELVVPLHVSDPEPVAPDQVVPHDPVSVPLQVVPDPVVLPELVVPPPVDDVLVQESGIIDPVELKASTQKSLKILLNR